MTTSRFAADNGLRLDDTKDAMAVIASGIEGCIFTLDDISSDFFDLRNGKAGEVFQKLINYHCRIALVIPADHQLGVRVEELAREHAAHPVVRFFPSIETALNWDL